MTRSTHALLLADFTISGLAPFLSNGEPPSLVAVSAPFDRVVPLLLDDTADCWKGAPEVALVWTRPDAAIKSFARILDHERVSIDEVLTEVDRFAEYVRMAANRVGALFVASWTWPSYDRGLGVLNLDTQVGRNYLLMRMNVRLIEALAGDSTVHVLDAGRWVAQAGAAASSPKLWHLGKIAFAPEVFRHAAIDIKAAVRGLTGATRKVVVLDLDDTLWGGVVGDVGWQGLNLGGHDPVGEAYVAFQRALKRLSHRGIVLAVVSKNTEAIALEAVDRHPEMVLRRQDLAGWRINWDDKAKNIEALASTLNLGLDSVVFIDDNPAERARVSAALPEVFVPEWPADKLKYEQALTELTCFDAVTLSDEDQARTRMYVSERERNVARHTAQSLQEYLASLDLKIRVERVDRQNIVRVVQLLNKTNQMNLTTRRTTEAQYLQWALSGSHQAFAFRVSDRFDDYGLTGIASVSPNGYRGVIADFVLSCRVMGRGVEEVMLGVLVDQARLLDLTELVAEYAPTPRNGPVKMFFDQESGFVRSGDGYEYVWALSAPYQTPDHVEISFATSVNCDTLRR